MPEWVNFSFNLFHCCLLSHWSAQYCNLGLILVLLFPPRLQCCRANLIKSLKSRSGRLQHGSFQTSAVSGKDVCTDKSSYLFRSFLLAGLLPVHLEPSHQVTAKPRVAQSPFMRWSSRTCAFTSAAQLRIQEPSVAARGAESWRVLTFQLYFDVYFEEVTPPLSYKPHCWIVPFPHLLCYCRV